MGFAFDNTTGECVIIEVFQRGVSRKASNQSECLESCTMTCIIKKYKPYTYANLTFTATDTTHMGDIKAWDGAKMHLEFVSWDSGEQAHVTYDVLATHPAKEPGDAGWVIGRITMSVNIAGKVAYDDVLMRRLVDDFNITMRNCVAQGQALVEFKDGVPVFEVCVTFTTI